MKHETKRTILRTLLASLAIVAATCAVLYASDLLTSPISSKTPPAGIPAAGEQLHALIVRTRGNADFPSAPGLSAKQQRAQLDEIAAFAGEYGYNAVFFEAVPSCDALYRSSILPSSAYWMGEQGAFAFFDPLDYLVNVCKESGIQVYAMIDPFAVSAEDLAESSPASKNPEWIAADGRFNPTELGVQQLAGSVAAELATRYDIAGIVLEGVEPAGFAAVDNYMAALSETATQVRSALRLKEGQRLGMLLPSSASPSAAALAESGALDFAVPDLAGLTEQELPSVLAVWQTSGVPYYPLYIASDDTAFTHLADAILYQERTSGSGLVVSSFSALHTDSRAAAYSLAASFAQTEQANMPDLTYSTEFAVTRPTETLTVGSDWESYFITGTSDPSLPVFYNGAEIARSPSGLWGVLVNVPYGTNTYTFTQGGVNKTATIVRNQPSASATISAIVKSSVYPSNAEAVLPGQSLKLSCTAPGGGTVTASVGGLTAALEPVAQAADGVAVTYQATIDVSSLAQDGEVKNIGPVTYTLEYGGVNSEQQSAGDVYACGNGARPVAVMKTFIVPVNANAADDGEYATILKEDCVDYITENVGGYYHLSSGGYVLKGAVDILEGSQTAETNASSLSLEQTDKGEKLTIRGTARPAFDGAMDDGSVTVRLYNVTGFENLSTAALESKLCSSIESSTEQNTVTLTFHLNEGVRLLGWDVRFNDNDTVIYLKQRPTLDRASAKPLSGITVALDPGHGGDDPGAAGVPGQNGPFENILNLADSYAIESRLTALGAKVHVLHNNENMTLNERVELAEQFDADMFISSHHNSLSETVDSNEVSGIEVYYYNDQSELLAEKIGWSLAEDTGRKLRFTEQSWYRVTMMTGCPAVLVESGYICNPTEYEEIADEYAMFKYGNAVADAVLQYFAA